MNHVLEESIAGTRWSRSSAASARHLALPRSITPCAASTCARRSPPPRHADHPDLRLRRPRHRRLRRPAAIGQQRDHGRQLRFLHHRDADAARAAQAPDRRQCPAAARPRRRRERLRHARRNAGGRRGTVALGRARGEIDFDAVSFAIRAPSATRWTASTCRSAPAKPWRWSAPRAAARPRWSTWCRASITPAADASASTATTSRPDAGQPARQHRACRPGRGAVQRHGRREHRLRRQARRRGRRDRAAARAAHAMEFIEACRRASTP